MNSLMCVPLWGYIHIDPHGQHQFWGDKSNSSAQSWTLICFFTWQGPHAVCKTHVENLAYALSFLNVMHMPRQHAEASYRRSTTDDDYWRIFRKYSTVFWSRIWAWWWSCDRRRQGRGRCCFGFFGKMEEDQLPPPVEVPRCSLIAKRQRWKLLSLKKKRCDKVVKSLVRTDYDAVEYESGIKWSRNNIVSLFGADYTTWIQLWFKVPNRRDINIHVKTQTVNM